MIVGRFVCPLCGTYVAPENEVWVVRGAFYCSEEHAHQAAIAIDNTQRRNT